MPGIKWPDRFTEKKWIWQDSCENYIIFIAWWSMHKMQKICRVKMIGKYFCSKISFKLLLAHDWRWIERIRIFHRSFTFYFSRFLEKKTPQIFKILTSFVLCPICCLSFFDCRRKCCSPTAVEVGLTIGDRPENGKKSVEFKFDLLHWIQWCEAGWCSNWSVPAIRASSTRHTSRRSGPENLWFVIHKKNVQIFSFQNLKESNFWITSGLQCLSNSLRSNWYFVIRCTGFRR